MKTPWANWSVQYNIVSTINATVRVPFLWMELWNVEQLWCSSTPTCPLTLWLMRLVILITEGLNPRQSRPSKQLWLSHPHHMIEETGSHDSLRQRRQCPEGLLWCPTKHGVKRGLWLQGKHEEEEEASGDFSSTLCHRNMITGATVDQLSVSPSWCGQCN